MGAEPESDMTRDTRLTADEWAAWALLGDPYGRVPATLRGLASRVARAVEGAQKQALARRGVESA